MAVDQAYLGGPETAIRARKGSGLTEISAIHGVAPPEACRRVSLEIDFSGSLCGAIFALAVDQVYLVGPVRPETPIQERKGSGLAEISTIYKVAPTVALRRVSQEIDFSCLRDRAILFLPWPSIKCT